MRYATLAAELLLLSDHRRSEIRHATRRSPASALRPARGYGPDPACAPRRRVPRLDHRQGPAAGRSPRRPGAPGGVAAVGDRVWWQSTWTPTVAMPRRAWPPSPLWPPPAGASPPSATPTPRPPSPGSAPAPPRAPLRPRCRRRPRRLPPPPPGGHPQQPGCSVAVPPAAEVEAQHRVVHGTLSRADRGQPWWSPSSAAGWGSPTATWGLLRQTGRNPRGRARVPPGAWRSIASWPTRTRPSPATPPCWRTAITASAGSCSRSGRTDRAEARSIVLPWRSAAGSSRRAPPSRSIASWAGGQPSQPRPPAAPGGGDWASRRPSSWGWWGPTGFWPMRIGWPPSTAAGWPTSTTAGGDPERGGPAGGGGGRVPLVALDLR